jgi:twitching motility protein PilI
MASRSSNSLPASPDWLAPTAALTRFRAPGFAASGAAAEAPAAAWFGFRVGSLGLLLPPGVYGEVIGQARVNPFPNTQPWFSGMLNLRGNLVPVFDLRRLLDEGGADQGKRHLFGIDRGEKTVALRIDGLPEAQGALPPPLKQLPPLPAVLKPHVHEGYTQHGQLWLHIQFDALFKALGGQVALG